MGKDEGSERSWLEQPSKPLCDTQSGRTVFQSHQEITHLGHPASYPFCQSSVCLRPQSAVRSQNSASSFAPCFSHTTGHSSLPSLAIGTFSVTCQGSGRQLSSRGFRTIETVDRHLNIFRINLSNDLPEDHKSHLNV